MNAAIDAGLEAGFVLNIRKEIPWTSHDAVARVRRILGIRAVGHCGSLDPLADGVLVVGVGRGTKLASHIMELPKVYRGTMILGRRTSTGDAGGAILEERAAPALDQEQLRSVAAELEGPGMQKPPMVSAVKQDGRRLYELARKGIQVERPARSITIHRFEIAGFDPPRVDFELGCSRGTYVRTLVEEFAGRLGTIASVECLTRTRVGHFAIEDSCRITSPPCSEAAGLRERAIAPAEALKHLPAARVDPHWVRKLRQGLAPPWRWLSLDSPPAPGSTLRLLGPGSEARPEGELLAIATVEMLPGPADRPIELASLLRLERVL